MRSRVHLSVLAVALGAIAIVGCSTTPAATPRPPTTPPTAAPSPTEAVSPAASASAAPSAGRSAAASPAGSPAGSAAAGSVTVTTAEGGTLAFDPADVSVTAEEGSTVTVTFVNRSDNAHNLTFGDPIDAGGSAALPPGDTETFELEAPAPGDYPFVCMLHPGMEGTLHVEA